MVGLPGRSVGRRVDRHLKPVLGAGVEVLDPRRRQDCFVRVPGGAAPGDNDAGEWQALLSNLNLTTVSAGRPAPTIDGTLPFGKSSKRFLPQSCCVVRLWKQTDTGRGGKTDEPGIGLRSAGKQDRGRIR